MDYPEIKVFKSNPSLTGFARLIPGIQYSELSGQKLTIIQPWGVGKGEKYPLVVFVQGSAWTVPDVNYEIPQLSQL
ncbi:MAG: alpha/beta hydrolase, partial [Lentisphaeria bacterium]|nr:alpha/beta hydrolase [Lentisphaeria bacterium]